MDTHCAVAYASAMANSCPGVPKVVFATGHPAKQLDTMTKITGRSIPMPLQLTNFMTQRRHATILPPTLPALKKLLQTIQLHNT